MPVKTRPFSACETSHHIRTYLFENGGLCVRALRCYQGTMVHGHTFIGQLSANRHLRT